MKFIQPVWILNLILVLISSVSATASINTSASGSGHKTFAILSMISAENISSANITAESYTPTLWLPIIDRTSDVVSIFNINVLSKNVRVYEKYEVRFSVDTSADYPLFQYDKSPPPGVVPKTGITVEGIVTTPSGKVLRQPAFYTTAVERIGSGKDIYFVETNRSYWVLRFSPQEPGQHQVQLLAKDASGTAVAPVGTFMAEPPLRKGFIGVSKPDPRYFEFSNGEIYWPIGPAWADNKSTNPNARSMDYAQYKDTGQNLERVWLAGFGAYSTNFARWISTAERHGNEGVMTRLNFREKYPGHDLSYEIFYPEGFRMSLPRWSNDMFAPRVKPNTTYQLKLILKTANISGPRNPAYPYGLVIKLHDFVSHEENIATTENMLRSKPEVIKHITTNRDWYTLNTTFTTPSQVGTDLSLYLDNVASGQVYIDEFSMKEILPDGGLGGELIRNPRADIHTYVDPRGAAFFDWQVEQGEQNGVLFKYVVHDKNDWIQNHLLTNGQWAAEGDGYYQPENTKARWLLRQWYRYLAARWGYSTAIHSWELNNEGPPDDDPAGSGTSPHWVTAQAFASFMHNTNAHPQLVTTSFWCCWRPAFWGNETNFPDIDYADIHEYTGNPQAVNQNYANDMAAFVSSLGDVVFAANIRKPTLLGEHGITVNGWDVIPDLQKPNPGIWYHNTLWAGLHKGAVFAPNYWFSEHIGYINREQLSKPFYEFVKTLDLNKGGYSALDSTVSNVKLRVLGQKNLAKNKAHLWIQNSDHTWRKVMDGVTSAQTGTITFRMNPDMNYTIEWWDTYNGGLKQQQILRSDGTGALTLSVSKLTDDVAVKIYP